MRSDEAKAEAGATQAGVPAPDIPLQPSFDGEDTTHRFRYMEPGPDAALCRSAATVHTSIEHNPAYCTCASC